MEDQLGNTDDFDEDVVFENSPLYQHLQDVGHMDFESCPMASSKTTQENLQVTSTTSGYYNTVKSLGMKIKDTIYSLCGNNSGQSLEEQVNSEYHKLYTNLLCSSNLLAPTDREFLETYGSSLYIANTAKKLKYTKYTSILSVLVVLVACLVGIGKQLTTSNNSPGILLWPLSIVVLALILYLTIQIVRIVKQYTLKQQHTGNIDKLCSLLQQSETFVSTLKKSIRLVQETELIARGFLMVSAKTPIARLEQSHRQGQQRQCPVLRQVIFNTTRDVILTLRMATCALLEKYPLSSEVDNIGNYVSSIPLEDMGLCFTSKDKSSSVQESDKNLSDNDVIREATDDFSIAALKAMSNLLNDQGSEFIRRLALCFCPEAFDDVKQWTDSEFYRSFSNLLVVPEKTVETCLSSLQKSYKFHRIGRVDKDSEKTTSVGRKHESLPSGDVLMAVHSLELHLQVALKRVQEFQEKMESLSELDEIKKEGETLSTSLTQIENDLESCKGCWDEGVIRFHQLLGTSSKQGNWVSQSTDTDENSGSGAVEKEPIQLFGLPEPEIEFDDQIFEGYTDPTEIDDIDWDYEPMTLEEKEQRKRQKEESVRMLRELRSVLAVRTTERERLKQEKLAKKQNQNPSKEPTHETCVDTAKEQTQDTLVDSSKEPMQKSCVPDNVGQINKEGSQSLLEKESVPTACDEMTEQQELQIDGNECNDATGGTPSDALMKRMSDENSQSGIIRETSTETGSEDKNLDLLMSQPCVDAHDDPCVDAHDEQAEKGQDDVFSLGCHGDGNDEEDMSDDPPPLPTVVDRDRLLAKLGQQFDFTSSIAAQVARRSQNLNLQVQTFEDEGEDFLEG